MPRDKKEKECRNEEEWEALKITVDSGAVDTVGPKGIAKEKTQMLMVSVIGEQIRSWCCC
jgi:hypothetical protein